MTITTHKTNNILSARWSAKATDDLHIHERRFAIQKKRPPRDDYWQLDGLAGANQFPAFNPGGTKYAGRKIETYERKIGVDSSRKNVNHIYRPFASSRQDCSEWQQQASLQFPSSPLQCRWNPIACCPNQEYSCGTTESYSTASDVANESFMPFEIVYPPSSDY